MSRTDMPIEWRIATSLLGLLAFAIFAFLLAVLRWGWRGAAGRFWQWTLVVSVYFGVFLAGMALVVLPAFRWVVLHDHFDVDQIEAESLSVERFVKPDHAVVFSNGEQRPIGIWPTLLCFVLVFSWWGLVGMITREVARRFVPFVWAEIPAFRRDHAGERIARPAAPLETRG